MHGLGRFSACAISPDQGQNPCFLHWQADSSALSHQGSPISWLLKGDPFTHRKWFPWLSLDYQNISEYANVLSGHSGMPRISETLDDFPAARWVQWIIKIGSIFPLGLKFPALIAQIGSLAGGISKANCDWWCYFGLGRAGTLSDHDASGKKALLTTYKMFRLIKFSGWLLPGEDGACRSGWNVLPYLAWSQRVMRPLF